MKFSFLIKIYCLVKYVWCNGLDLKCLAIRVLISGGLCSFQRCLVGGSVLQRYVFRCDSLVFGDYYSMICIDFFFFVVYLVVFVVVFFLSQWIDVFNIIKVVFFYFVSNLLLMRK